jgi:succinate dehydrogenase / fumarate reductase, cytochrome b subunit
MEFDGCRLDRVRCPDMSFFNSSIGKKMGMAVTGFFLFGFVIAHMLGNLQIFLGAEALNAYAAQLQSLTELLWPARIFLLTNLILHVWLAVRLTAENRRARPVPYGMKKTVQASYASKTMMMTGLIVLAFTIYHLLHFTFGKVHPQYYHLTDAQGRNDVYSMVVLSFRAPWIAAAYILAMIPLCLHLSHGVSSLFQSLGLNHAKYQPVLTWAGKVVGLVIFIGNSSIPLAVYLHWVALPQGVS